METNVKCLGSLKEYISSLDTSWSHLENKKLRFWTETRKMPGWKDWPISATFELLLAAPAPTMLCSVLYRFLILIVKKDRDQNSLEQVFY